MAVLTAVACEENIYSDDTVAKEAEVSISFMTVPETSLPVLKSIDPALGVDEGTSDGYKVTDFWLMQYDDAGSMVGSPRYYRLSDYEGTSLTASVVLPPANAEYTCVVIANTHSDMFYKNMGDVTTLEKLKKSCVRINEEYDLYQENGASSKDLMMNGVVKLTSESNSLNFRLFRNIAKVTVPVTNKAGSNVNIKSIQVRNVPDMVCYADQLLSGTVPCPTSSEAGFFDYPIEDIVMEASSSDQTISLTFYLPRNTQGTTTSNTAEGKNNGAPSFATFIEILAEDSINEIPLRYTFYLGANTTNDFNVIPNHEYTFPITISGTGNPDLDSRVESLGSVTLSDANCFIVNPLSGTMQPVFQVTTERINQFWSSVDGDDENILDGSSEWVAEVLWQDTGNRVIDFCNASGNVIMEGSNPSDRYEGTGVNSFYFKTRQIAYTDECNVIVGIRLKSDLSSDTPKYLWSWHLWITSYNPTPIETVEDGKYIYSAKNGGELHRYEDALGGNVWSELYAGKFIMDRNIGAKTAQSGADLERVGGFYYQWGRKDPFPYVIPIYDINGKRKTWNESYESNPSASHDPIRPVDGPALMKDAVLSPYAYYVRSGHWISAALGNVWNNPSWHASATGKSVFDPCPPGWKLPDNNIWRIFQLSPGTEQPMNAATASNPTGIDFYISKTGEGPTAFYPAMGRRYPLNPADVQGAHGNVIVWAYTNQHLYTTGRLSQYTRTSSNSSGHPVRCIQE